MTTSPEGVSNILDIWKTVTKKSIFGYRTMSLLILAKSENPFFLISRGDNFLNFHKKIKLIRQNAKFLEMMKILIFKIFEKCWEFLRFAWFPFTFPLQTSRDIKQISKFSIFLKIKISIISKIFAFCRINLIFFMKI